MRPPATLRPTASLRFQWNAQTGLDQNTRQASWQGLELYSTAHPREYVNLAKDPANAENLAAMKQSLAKRRAELGLENSTPSRRAQ